MFRHDRLLARARAELSVAFSISRQPLELAVSRRIAKQQASGSRDRENGMRFLLPPELRVGVGEPPVPVQYADADAQAIHRRDKRLAFRGELPGRPTKIERLGHMRQDGGEDAVLVRRQPAALRPELHREPPAVALILVQQTGRPVSQAKAAKQAHVGPLQQGRIVAGKDGIVDQLNPVRGQRVGLEHRLILPLPIAEIGQVTVQEAFAIGAGIEWCGDPGRAVLPQFKDDTAAGPYCLGDPVQNRGPPRPVRHGVVNSQHEFPRRCIHCTIPSSRCTAAKIPTGAHLTSRSFGGRCGRTVTLRS